MTRRPSRFTAADVRRARKALGEPCMVEMLPDGTVRVIPIPPQDARSGPDEKLEKIIL